MIENMLREIHTRFIESVRGFAVGLQSHTTMQGEGTPSVVDFELHEDCWTQSRLVCPHATINPDFSSHMASETHHALFTCQCVMPPPGQTSHKAKVTAFRRKLFPIVCISVRAVASCK